MPDQEQNFTPATDPGAPLWCSPDTPASMLAPGASTTDSSSSSGVGPNPGSGDNPLLSSIPPMSFPSEDGTWHPPLLAPPGPADAAVSSTPNASVAPAPVCEAPPPAASLSTDANSTPAPTADSSQDDDRANAMAGGAPNGRFGNCTKEQWYALNLQVKEQCKTNMPRACTPGDSPEDRSDKAAQFQRCIDARQAMADTCYDGGDQGHRDQIENLNRGRDKCNEPQPVPVPIPDPVKVPDKVEDKSDFMDKMAKATGLTGAALIAYLIISEGSRIVFPPRNLIPVP